MSFMSFTAMTLGHFHIEPIELVQVSIQIHGTPTSGSDLMTTNLQRYGLPTRSQANPTGAFHH